MSSKNLPSFVINGASALGLVVLLLAAAGSKPNAGAGGDAGTTATTSSDSDESEPKVSVSGKKVPNFEYIRGTCENVKKAGQCDEFYGLIPKFSPDMCKTDGGNFVTSSPKPNPCPKEKLIGTCHYPQSKSGEPGQFANYYASNAHGADELKKECLDPAGSGKNEWIDAPAAAAEPTPSAAPAVKATAKPAAKAKTK